MLDIDIHTTLGIKPFCKKRDWYLITRGATETLNLDFSDEIYTFEDMEQLTLVLKQDDNMFKYNMIEYFELTEDTTVDDDTTYYERIEVNSHKGSGYKFKIYEPNPGDNPAALGLYEQVDIGANEESYNWQLNKHFDYDAGPGYFIINFMLSSFETKQFRATRIGELVLFEAATKLNTDALKGMHGQDAIIIKKLPGIVVGDSLYANRYNNAEGLFCSEELVCE